MNLLLDLGNTRLKCALAAPDGLASRSAFAHREPGFDAALAAWLAPWRDRPGLRAWLAAVAPDVIIDRVLAALRAAGADVRRVRTQADVLGLRVAYPDALALGVDRWLGMLAVRARGAGPHLLASVGTALTVDAIEADGRHLGGLIAPSPDAMRQALVARAPRLDVPGGAVHPFADSTPDAIRSGCVLAAAALVERSLGELARRSGAEPSLWLTGGGAAALRSWIPAHRMMPDLVLEGLACWAAHCAE
jgi:type III pantothenate kinase